MRPTAKQMKILSRITVNFCSYRNDCINEHKKSVSHIFMRHTIFSVLMTRTRYVNECCIVREASEEYS